MFEDSTFESMGKIRTRSRGWMIATFAFNGSILLALILIPLMHPAALPRIISAIPMTVPPPAEQEPKPVVRPVHVQANPSEMDAARRIQAPSVIPDRTWIPSTREEPTPINFANLGDGANNATGPGNPMGGVHSMHPDVRQAPASTARVSGGVMQGMLIRKVVPNYPAPARAMHIGGTVELQATISRSGTIENLRVVNGPPLLQQAARDAVMQWRYQPYLLNGEPVEVETTINVEFKLE
jgi:periplasmic protein TonB